jgi:hypothetical protein
MKTLIFIIVLLASFTIEAQTTSLKGFTQDEKTFVKNVINMQDEKLVEVTKRKDKCIVLEFDSTMYVLLPNGHVGEMWMRTDGDWLSMGREEDAY